MTHVDERELRGTADWQVAARVVAAQRKAHRCFPGPIGEALSAQLDGAYELRALLGPGSLSMRLLAEIESLPEPGSAP
jgi:hypothetical protein